MKTIRAIFEDGVFRPTERVELPDHCTVEFEPRPVDDSKRETTLDAIYDVLSERYESGESGVAARHDQHFGRERP